MSTEPTTGHKLAFDNITLDQGAVIIDGHRLDGACILVGPNIHWGGDNLIGPTLTLTLIASEVTITQAAHDWKRDHQPEMWSESGCPQWKDHGGSCDGEHSARDDAA